MTALLNAIDGVTCNEASGAFYCFPDVSGTFEKLGVRDSVSFCEVILEKAHVALVPGAAFGMDTHVRLSFACSVEQIEKGLERLADALN
jgi:aspartate aminotransferase